jgi:peptide/nickel transport system substrate-binding protein
MTRKRRTVALVVALGVIAAVALAGSAAAQSESGSAAPETTTMVIGTVNNITTVNPLRAIETPEYELLSLQYSLLFGFSDEDMSPTINDQAVAAEIPTVDNGGISEDYTTYTIKIKEGLKWSDGEPLTAADVAFTYNFMLDKNFTNFTSYLPNVKSITAPDDTTLLWEATKPTIAPLIPPWIYILPEHVWGDFSRSEARDYDNYPDPVVSGPFQLSSWKKEQSWSLRQNPEWSGQQPSLDEIVFKYFSNAETMTQDLKSGQIDYAYTLPVNLFSSVQNVDGITAVVGAATGFTQFTMNSCGYLETTSYCEKNPSTGNPALLDPTVRTAMAMAIDKEALVERVLGGYGTPGSTIIPPAFAFWHADPDPAIPFDIQGANQMLEDAGYTDTNGDGVREDPKTGEELNMRLILRSEDSESPAYGKLIQGWLKQIGVGTEAVSYTDGKLINAWYDNDYDLYVWGWGPDPDPDFILSTFTSDQCGSWSDTCYSNPDYDQLYEDQRLATSREDRKAIIDEMQQVIYETIPESVLYYSNDLFAYRSDRWTGFTPQPTPAEDGTGANYFFAYGNTSYLTVKPVGAGGSAAASSSGLPPWVWIAAVAAVVVIVVLVFAMRGRGSDEDKA